MQINLTGDADDQAIHQRLSHWELKHALNTETTCLVQSGKQQNDDATFVEQQVPHQMMLHNAIQVSLTALNTGSSTWTRKDGYRLGSQAPQDNHQWGPGRVELPVESVRPGESVTFIFNVTPFPGLDGYPPASRRFRWRMVRDGAHWFGTFSQPVSVELDPDGSP
jgi:hypothetical protein